MHNKKHHSWYIFITGRTRFIFPYKTKNWNVFGQYAYGCIRQKCHAMPVLVTVTSGKYSDKWWIRPHVTKKKGTLTHQNTHALTKAYFPTQCMCKQSLSQAPTIRSLYQSAMGHLALPGTLRNANLCALLSNACFPERPRTRKSSYYFTASTPRRRAAACPALRIILRVPVQQDLAVIKLTGELPLLHYPFHSLRSVWSWEQNDR